MKRHFLLLAFLVSILLPITAYAEFVYQITITTQEPKVGDKPSLEASVAQYQKMHVADVNWTGEFEDGRFVQGRNYEVAVKVQINENSNYTFAKPSQSVITINGRKGQVTASGEKRMTIRYKWKELGGPNPDLPENKLKASLKKVAAAYPATNMTNKDDLLKYLKKEMSGAEIWLVGGAYQSVQRLPTDTDDGYFSITIGITKDNVTLNSHDFTVTIPARNKSPYAQKLYEDKKLMQAALKSHTVSPKTNPKEILSVVNSAAIHGTKAQWEGNYTYEQSTSKKEGLIEGNLVLTLGDEKEVIVARRGIPMSGSSSEAAISRDESAIYSAFKSFIPTNNTTEADIIKVANDAITSGSELSLTSFTKTEATFDNKGKIQATFNLKNGRQASYPSVKLEFKKIRASIPEGLGINDEEWEVLRLTNIERHKYNSKPLIMVAPLIKSAKIRVEEIKILYTKDHMRPDGSSCFTAIDREFRQVRQTAENAYMSPDTPAEAVEGWMNSPGHRLNLINPLYRYVGMGASQGNSYKANKYWIQMFASGPQIVEVNTSTGGTHFNSVHEMEEAYLICKTSEGITGYMPLEADIMEKNGVYYTLRLDGRVVTLSVGSN